MFTKVAGTAVAGLVALAFSLTAETGAEEPAPPFGWSAPLFVTDRAHWSGGNGLAADAEGNFWVPWTDTITGYLMLQKFNRRGEPILGPLQVDSGGRAGWSAIGVDPGTGDIFLIWNDARDWPPSEGKADIYCAKLDSEGNKIWGDKRVTFSGLSGSLYSVAVDSTGALRAIRQKTSGSESTIGYTRVLPDGTVWIQYKTILEPGAFSVDRPSMALDANDDMHLVWGQQESAMGPIVVKYMKVDDAGDPIVGPVQLSPDYCGDADLAVDAAGNVHIVWMYIVGSLPPWRSYFFYCRLNNDGQLILEPTQVNQGTDSGWYSSILLDHNERPHIVWYETSGMVNFLPYAGSLSVMGIRHVALDGFGRAVSDEQVLDLGHRGIYGWMRTARNRFGEMLLLYPFSEYYAPTKSLELIRTLPQETCRVGTVRLGTGGAAEDVLFINGSPGNDRREMDVPEGGAIVATLGGLAEGSGGGRYVIHATLQRPDEDTVTLLPKGVGLSCFDMQLSPFGAAAPSAIWNTLGHVGRVGASQYFDGSPIPNPGLAPVTFLNLPGGDPVNLPAGTEVMFQGLIEDRRSAGRLPASVTNAVLVKIQSP